MDETIDARRLAELARDLMEVDSPVGYYPEIHAWLEARLASMGYAMEVDRKATAYVRVEGKDTSRTVMVGAHLDALGLIARGFDADGSLRVRQLGGVNYHSLEGETCRVHCRDGRMVEGQIVCTKHSVHVFDDARSTARDEETMRVSLIADVSSPDDARALGVTEGAIVAVDPHVELFENGYIVGRNIDDKAAVAVLLDILAWLHDSGQKPAATTLFAFPMYEEIGHGGAYVPEGVSEYVALDITLIGPDYDADEHQVGIICADHRGPYDWELTNRLIACAEKACTPGRWNTQVCYRYTTDAAVAAVTGSDLKSAAFGMACRNTHGRERCHVDALVETERLARAYLMGTGLSDA